MGREMVTGARNGDQIFLLEPAYTRTSFEQNMALPDRTLDAYATARAGSKCAHSRCDEYGRRA